MQLDKSIVITLEKPKPLVIQLGVPVVAGGGSQYDGEYEITPNFENQILHTKNKTLKDDIAIKSISVVRTSNTSGGNTIIIGG